MRSSTTIFAYVDDGGRVEAIELASPGHGIAGGDQVVFDDVDLFIDEADVVIAKLEAKGVELTEGDDACTTTAPDVLLGLWRDGDPAMNRVDRCTSTRLSSPGPATTTSVEQPIRARTPPSFRNERRGDARR
jgi:hypothetical protein